MVFSHLIFVFCFFALNMLLYWLMPNIALKNRVMLVFSLVFYAWAGPVYLLLLAGMTLADWIAALFISRAKKTWGRKTALFFGVTVNLALLCVFKYLTFLLQTAHDLTGVPEEVLQIALPIGISFYTFQLISYMVDVYRGNVQAETDYLTLLFYVSLYHQCIAGPIIRYETVAHELRERSATMEDMAYGIRRFSIGLAKKALLANHCGDLANSFLVATDSVTGAAVLTTRPALSILLGSICYTLEIYLDFSAYSDMAIGMGRMIGFHYLENFDYPYESASIREFWKRWHISLSSFFRDYLYIPLGGSRGGAVKTVRNLLIVWACTGFWHGASWNYLLWGLFYFTLLCLERFAWPGFPDRLPRLVSHLYTLALVNFGWMLFRCEDLGWLGIELKGLLGLNGNGFTNYETNTTLRANCFFLLFAVIACTSLLRNLGRLLEGQAQKSRVGMILWQVLSAVFPIVLVFLSTASLVGDSYNPFLYFRF